MNDFANIFESAAAITKLDRITLKALQGYSPSSAAINAKEENEILVNAGLFLGKHGFDHDDVVRQAKAITGKTDRNVLAGNFLAGLGAIKPEYMGGLIAYSIINQMPLHSFSKTPAENCGTCSCFAKTTLDLTFCNSIRYTIGALVNTDVFQLWFHLEISSRINPIEPNKSDIELFRLLIQAIASTDPSTKPKELIPIIRKQFKKAPSVEQTSNLIDSLGALGILENRNHKGFLEKYTNLGVAPSKSRNSDWSYPVDWWTGADGINMKAVNYWFGRFIQ